MRTIYINIIFNNNTYGLTNDAKILVKYLDQIKGDISIKVRPVSIYSYLTGYVDINIFLETYNPVLYHYGKVNILIPNQEWFYKDWKPYLKDLDYIWCKTKFMTNIFKNLVDDEDKVKFISWTSQDRNILDSIKKTQFIHLAGKSLYKGTQNIINNWDINYPPIKIIYQNKVIKEKSQDNIEYFNNKIEDKKLNILMNESKFHLCLSETEGYGHYINEGLSCGSLILTTDRSPMNEFVSKEYCVKIRKNINLKDKLDTLSEFDESDLKKKINYVTNLNHNEFKKQSQINRKKYLESIKNLRKNLKNEFISLINFIDNKKFINKIPLEISTKSDKLPFISIVTLTYNRPEFFTLMKLNYFGIDYPRDKLEWVIIDDSDDNESIEKNILNLEPEKNNINYIYLGKKTTIGEKRNIGVRNCKYEYIAFMDDDDIYLPRNLLIRLSYLDFYQKECCYTTTIGCFHIDKIISHINVPPLNKPFYQRLSEASLLFKKSFWIEKGFTDTDTEEASDFLNSRYNKSIEIPYKEIFISLLHKKNISSKITVGNTPNGCHFGLSDDLFKLITNIKQ